MNNEFENMSKTKETAEQYCQTLRINHYENFPVGKFVQKKLRKHIHAIYAFARSADDFDDEAQFEGQRLNLLSYWRDQLYSLDQKQKIHPIFEALKRTIDETDLPLDYLNDLLKAFEFDVKNNRHQSFDSLLAYSRLSANPVGKCILWIHAYRDEKLIVYSDKICTALQLTNFWQDVAVDLKKNRIYLPQDLLKKYQLTEEELVKHSYNEKFQNMMSELNQKTRHMFFEGFPLIKQLHFPLSFEMKMICNGGMQILHKLEKDNFNVFEKRPKLKKLDWLKMLCYSLRRKKWNI